MAKKPPTTLPDEPIGVLDDGKISVVERDSPPFKIKVVDDEGNEVEVADDD